MKTICAIRNNPCRDIVEGVVHLPTLSTVPLRDFVLTPVPAAEVEFEVPVQVIEGPKAKGRPWGSTSPLNDLLQKFRETKPGQFTALTAVQFCRDNGWDGGKHPQGTISEKLRSLQQRGELEQVVRLDAGKDRTIFWKFVLADGHL